MRSKLKRMNLFQNLWGRKSSVSFSELQHKGAQIVDVRTPSEYAQGHLEGSLNIPLPALLDNLKILDNKKPIITCCASGIRSGNAKKVLETNGFDKVYNGGGWKRLQNKLSM